MIDQFDRKICGALQANARITLTELAEQIGLSKTPTQQRMKRLEREGYIHGYHARLDPERFDATHIAFVEVKLNTTTTVALQDFNQAVKAVAQIEQCHMIAGGFDYLLKVRTRDTAAYRRMLGDTLAKLPHIAQTSTYIALEAVKDGPLAALR